MTRERERETDAALVARARSGDASAFESLVRRHYGAAHAIALATTGNTADAEDVCQEAFIRALEHLDGCREPAKFSAWLLRIVRNQAHNHREYLQVRATEPLDAVPGPRAASSPRPAERAELRHRLEEAVRTLSKIRREVVLLHDLEGWPHREIGEHLGISTGMSRQHLMLARRTLRAILPEDLIPGRLQTSEDRTRE